MPMQITIFNPNAPKKPANLSINSDLLQKARALNINLSQALEQRLVELLRTAQRQEWLEQNQVALEGYNRHIEHDGIFTTACSGSDGSVRRLSQFQPGQQRDHLYLLDVQANLLGSNPFGYAILIPYLNSHDWPAVSRHRHDRSATQIPSGPRTRWPSPQPHAPPMPLFPHLRFAARVNICYACVLDGGFWSRPGRTRAYPNYKRMEQL